MGSGKSVVGPRVAARLAWAFEDTDLAVERDRGQAVERIFREVGEVGFRRAERDVLRERSRPWFRPAGACFSTAPPDGS
jgi:shikimate kinase